jgi:phi13 family phage major tail protein
MSQAQRIGLKGFAGLSAFPQVIDTPTEYSATGTKLKFVGASSCSITDNRTDFSIPGDDGIYDSGSDWESTDVVPVIHEVDLATLAALAGASIDETKKELEEGTFDIPNVVALTFRALRRDGGYRCYRYYCCKLVNYSVSHATKGQSNDGQPYTLTFKALPRKIDGKIRGTADVSDLAEAEAWCNTIPSVSNE